MKKTSKLNTKEIEPCKEKVIYLDNNGTTKMCMEAKNNMLKWLDSCSNPSSDSLIAKKSKDLIECTKKYIAKHSGVPYSKYSIIFTSGASESNCLILRSIVEAYARITGKLPHIITSSTEHKSIIQCCNHMQSNNLVTITYIEPNAFGVINPELVKKSITDNTALITIMAANNEIGCMNDIKKIGEIANQHRIPFHTDAVQLYGKYKLSMVKNHIDAISMSFHKLYGPMGLGMLIINNDLINGYKITGQISGTQQNELRGGTENVPAIAAAVPSIQYTFKDRDLKNKKMILQKKRIIHGLEQKIPLGEYKRYFDKSQPTRNEFIILGPSCNGNHKSPNVLPNTLLLSFVKNRADENEEFKPFCNTELKKYLNKKNIIVSVGSACSTSSKSASHVLSAIKASNKIKQGTIRISLSDNNTNKEIDTFIKEIIKGVKAQMSLDIIS